MKEKINLDWKLAIVIVVFLVLLWFVVLKPSGAKTEAKENEAMTKLAQSTKVKTAFNPLGFVPYVKSKGFTKTADYLKTKGLTVTDIKQSIKALYDAKGFFNDDEEKIYNIVRAIPNITIMSIIANGFSKFNIGISMQTFFSDFLGEKEMSKLYKIIDLKNFL